MKLEELKDKKILILGFGREGQDTFLFLKRSFPDKVFGIADKNRKAALPKISQRSGIKWHLGKNYLKALNDYDAIIKSPGIPFRVLPADSRKKIITQTDIFFENCPGEIVGITGTKGKSTTASLVYDILQAGKIKARLIGNIGLPVLNILSKAEKTDVFVYELSSHQLYNLRRSPRIAVLLNIYQEHLDYYRNFNEYAKAKANITRHQTKNDYFIYNVEDRTIEKIAKKSKAKKIPIRGEYYELDKNAARVVGKIFKIPPDVIEKAIKQFKPLPHRLELVGTYRGITFYNDSLATIPEATMGAINALGDRVETIMLGGFERNADFTFLAEKILGSGIKNLILFPTTGKRIWKTIRLAQGKQPLKHFFTDNMEDAVRLAYLHTKKGRICLLSTASSSFSIFRDYKEKGDLFKKYVKSYAKKN